MLEDLKRGWRASGPNTKRVPNRRSALDERADPRIDLPTTEQRHLAGVLGHPDVVVRGRVSGIPRRQVRSWRLGRCD